MVTPTAMAAPHSFSPNLDEAKRLARNRARVLRDACDPALGRALARHVLAELPPPDGAVVGGFWPLEGEIDIRPLLHALHARGHEVALPETTRKGEALRFRRWQPAAPLRQGRFGTLHPDGSETIPDFLLVPLLGFDRRGHRLGYGGGYYDRTLASLPLAFALGCAFAAQELDAVPAGEYDVPLPAIATETGVIRIHRT
jgi:5-formyltetrahydrofolate cyclo-ligase